MSNTRQSQSLQRTKPLRAQKPTTKIQRTSKGINNFEHQYTQLKAT